MSCDPLPLNQQMDPINTQIITEDSQTLYAQPEQLFVEPQLEQQPLQQQIGVQLEQQPMDQQHIRMQQFLQQQAGEQINEQRLLQNATHDAKFEKGISSNPGSCARRSRNKKMSRAQQMLGDGLGMTHHTHAMAQNLEQGKQENKNTIRANRDWCIQWEEKPENVSSADLQESRQRKLADSLPLTDEEKNACPMATTANMENIAHLLKVRDRNNLLSNEPEQRADAMTKLITKLSAKDFGKNALATLAVTRNAADTLQHMKYMEHLSEMIEGDNVAVALLPKELILKFNWRKEVARLAAKGTEQVLRLNGLDTDGTLTTPLEAPATRQQLRDHENAMENSRNARREIDTAYQARSPEETYLGVQLLKSPVGVTQYTHQLATQRRGLKMELTIAERATDKWFHKWTTGIGKEAFAIRNSGVNKALKREGKSEEALKARPELEMTTEEKGVIPHLALPETVALLTYLPDEADKLNMVSNAPQLRAKAQEKVLDALLQKEIFESDCLDNINGIQNAPTIIHIFESGIADMASLLAGDPMSAELIPKAKTDKFSEVEKLYNILSIGARMVLNQNALNDLGSLRLPPQGRTAEAEAAQAAEQQRLYSRQYKVALNEYNEKYNPVN